MKRAVLVGVSFIMAVMCVAQMPPSHPQTGDANPHSGMQNSQGVPSSSREGFGSECGIRDSSAQSAIGLTRSSSGEWLVLGEGTAPGSDVVARARVWRESNWMVDLHDVPGQGMTTMHTGQMCFDSQGRITRMIDRYMDTPRCECMRFTALNFGTDGSIMRRQQKFVNVHTGVEMAAPDAAQGFPEIWEFRRLEQLPFYSLVKK